MNEPSGFWCELVARSPDLADEWYLGGAWAASAEEALDWLRDRAKRLTTFLEPSLGRVFAEWLVDAEQVAAQLAALADEQPISVNAGASDRIANTCDLYVFYSLTCRPVVTSAASATWTRSATEVGSTPGTPT